MARIPRILPLIAVAIGGVVAVRAVGVAPGLFDGAVAWAEEAVASAPATPAATVAGAAPAAAPGVCALTPEQLAQQAGLSPAELRVLQSLSARRTELDARDADLATLLPLMASAEQKLDERVKTLEDLKAEIQTLLGQAGEQEKAEIDRLVAVYSAMRPREAAAVFVTLDDSVRLPVAAAMRPRSLAAVMAQMPPAAARELTEKLARRFEAQQLATRAAVASAAPAPTAPAPQLAAQPAAATAATPQPGEAAAVPPRPRPRPAARPTQNQTPPRPAATRADAAPVPASQAPTAPTRQTVQ